VADLSGMNILVTGGTGSFGQAFCARALAVGANVTVYSRDEFKQSQMAAECGSDRLRFVVGDIRDLARLTCACDGMDVVVHAAAMKQVPACEDNPGEAIDSNVGGSRNVIAAANATGVRVVVGISTDKAAYPTSAYGATKLLAERLFAASAASPTRFCVVRLGNIFGSRGSVVPLFVRQAADGEVLTVTDRSMTRYSIMPDDAADLVLTAIEVARGEEIFVPKMPSYRVGDVADALAGPGGVRETGARAGEQTHECLITEAEAERCTDMGPYWVITRGSGDNTVLAAYSNTNDEWMTAEDIRMAAGV